MALTPPVISILSAAGTTLTVAFTADALATETVFYLLNPTTGAVLMTSAGHTPPQAVIAGLTPQTPYDVVAVSYTNPGPSDLSPPSLTKQVRAASWDGALKNVIVAEPVFGARAYDLYNAAGTALLQSASPYPTFVDDQVFASEQLAVREQYLVKAYVDETTPSETQIVKRFRTTRALCLVYGDMAMMTGYPGWPSKIAFRPKPYRVQPFVQQTLPIFWDAYAFPNYLGQWGAHLMSGTVVEVNFFDKIFEFIVPFAAQAALTSLSLVDRSLAVKNT